MIERDNFTHQNESPDDTAFIAREAIDEYRKTQEQKKLQEYLELPLERLEIIRQQLQKRHELVPLDSTKLELTAVKRAISIKTHESNQRQREEEEIARQVLHHEEALSVLRGVDLAVEKKQSQDDIISEQPEYIPDSFVHNGVEYNLTAMSQERRHSALAMIIERERSNNEAHVSPSQVSDMPMTTADVAEVQRMLREKEQPTVAYSNSANSEHQETSRYNQPVKSTNAGDELLVRSDASTKIEPQDEAQSVFDTLPFKGGKRRGTNGKLRGFTDAIAPESIKSILPSTIKGKVLTYGTLGLATAAVVGSGISGLSTDTGEQETLVVACEDEGGLTNPISSTTIDARADIAWSLASRAENEKQPSLLVGEKPGRLPQLTVEGVEIDLALCVNDTEAVKKDGDNLTINADNLVVRAMTRATSGTAGWEQISSRALAGAVVSEALTEDEANRYSLVMQDEQNIQRSSAVAVDMVAALIEKGEATIKKDQYVDSLLANKALEGLKTVASVHNKTVAIEGDKEKISIDFAVSSENADAPSVDFSDQKVRATISNTVVTSLGTETDKKQKDDAGK